MRNQNVHKFYSTVVVIVCVVPALFMGGCRHFQGRVIYPTVKNELQAKTELVPLPLTVEQLTVVASNNDNNAHHLRLELRLSVQKAAEWYRRELERVGWQLDSEALLQDGSRIQWWNRPDNFAFLTFTSLRKTKTTLECFLAPRDAL